MNRIKALIKRVRSIRGFTFVELLIAVLISFIILAAIFEVFIAQRRRYVTEDAMLEVENRGDFAIEYLTRTIQNSGFNTKQGMKFETASDHYFTTLMDENDNGVIEPSEVVTVSLNKPYRDVGATEQPTELVHDPDMDDFSGGKRQFSFDIYFDMNGDGSVADAEKFISGYNLNTARDDNSLDQKDAVKLYLTGPPYAIYRYSYRLLDESSGYGGGNPYIVNPQPDLVADGVDNFIIRYFDEEDLPLPVTYDNNGNRVTPKPPYVLSREDMSKIRRVEFEILLRSVRKDVKWTDSGTYPTGSIATYGDDGKPAGWSCGDPDFRANEPYLTDCAGLSDWDCFVKYCNYKLYPTVSGDAVPYQDNYRRLLLTSSVTPKNLVLNPYGSLTITADPTKVQCPDSTDATLTAVLKDREGEPIANSVINFYSTSLVSAVDVTGASNKDGDGNPITDANGSVTGIVLRAITPPNGKKTPVTVTVSADSKITVNVAGVDKSFPVYSSIVVPFVVGPPATITFINSPPSTNACDPADKEEFRFTAVDCNGLAVEGAVMDITLADEANPTAEFPPPASGIDPGLLFTDPATRAPVTSAADYSESTEDMGQYHFYYGSPLVESPFTGYIQSLRVTVTASEFEGRVLDDPVPDGWGLAVKTSNYAVIGLLPGSPSNLTMEPYPSYAGAGCKNNYLPIYAHGYDCGAMPTGGTEYPVWSSVIPADVASPPPIMGLLTTDVLVPGTEYNNVQMLWDGSKYRIYFLNDSCATDVVDERVQLHNYDKTDLPLPPTEEQVAQTMSLSVTECPVGMNITMRVREPHTTLGNGELTDGFYQDGCNYDNLDVEALVILNLPPSILCQDIQYNPVIFTVVSGGARFLDASENPTLTTVTVNSDSNGRAFAGLKLTSTSLTDVVIRAESTSGSYSASAEITLPVGPDEIVFAYRDNCYTDRLTPANPIRTADYVYVEVLDCNRNDTAFADTAPVTAYEWTGSFGDTETFTLTETGNNTGIFRGKIRTRALPESWSPVSGDGIIDLTNAGYFNINYEDEDGNTYRLYESPGPYVLTILDRCEDGIRFMEAFANQSYDGLTSEMTNFPFTTSASWRSFSSLNVTSNTDPALSPSANTVKKLILQYCDELYLSGSIFFKYIWNTGSVTFPPHTTPDATWRKGETLMWVDLDESVVGDAASEKEWTDLDVSYRFRYMGNPDDTGFGGTDTVTLNDYYLPGVDKGVCFFFRVAASSKLLSSLPGTPTMDMIDRGYVAVWTKDASGNPAAKLFRIDGVDTSVNPITLDITQVGGTIDNTMATPFTYQYDDPGYHRAEILLRGDEFNIYFDDFFMDFDGAGGASYIGGSSASDKNYVDGTVGFGVKDVIAKFDSIQVCGCPPMAIEASDLDFPVGSPVTLTMKEMIYGMPTSGPVTWGTDPSGSGTFSSNPSSTAVVTFTRTVAGIFPDSFNAVDAFGCLATLMVPPPTPTCVSQDFESYSEGATPASNDFVSWVGPWTVNQDTFAGSKGLRYRDSVSTTVRLIKASTNYSGIWSNHDTDGHDDYIVEADVRPTGTTSVAGLFFRNNGNAGYYLSIDPSSGFTRVRVRYNTNLTSSYGDTSLYSHTTGYTFSTSAIYHLYVKVDGSEIYYEVKKSGTTIDSGTISNTSSLIGGPGFRLLTNNAYFDNFNICTIP